MWVSNRYCMMSERRRRLYDVRSVAEESVILRGAARRRCNDTSYRRAAD